MNFWIPDPRPTRDERREPAVSGFLAGWGPEVPRAGEATPPDFAAQCEAILEAAPPVVSSIMGLYPPAFVARLKAPGIAWFANVSTVAEARAAEAAGADAVVAQGMEAGGHRGCFDAARAEAERSGCSHCCRRSPMRCAFRWWRRAASPTAAASPRRWRSAQARCRSARASCAARRRGCTPPGPTRSHARRPRAQCNPRLQRARRPQHRHALYTRRRHARRPASRTLPGATRPDAAMRDAAGRRDVSRMQAWAGQAAALARAAPASDVVRDVWEQGRALLAH